MTTATLSELGSLKACFISVLETRTGESLGRKAGGFSTATTGSGGIARNSAIASASHATMTITGWRTMRRPNAGKLAPLNGFRSFSPPGILMAITSLRGHDAGLLLEEIGCGLHAGPRFGHLGRDLTG